MSKVADCNEIPTVPPPTYSETIEYPVPPTAPYIEHLSDPRYLPAPVFASESQTSHTIGIDNDRISNISFPLLYYPKGISKSLNLVKTSETNLLPANFVTIARSKLSGITDTSVARVSRQLIKIAALLMLTTTVMMLVLASNFLGGPVVVGILIFVSSIISNLVTGYLLRKRIEECCHLLSEQSSQLVGTEIKLEYISKKLRKRHTKEELGGSGNYFDGNLKRINLDRMHFIKVSFKQAN
ncbi:hypothetical protein BKA69DRAFT_1065309 [Paraphysoderma sedebokerense]|nr:hypothetical protein BKA69DRAFT_1065309 [Paraphysoderma sedebokerense]